MIFFDITFEKSRAVISYLFAIVFDINIVLFFYTILPKDTIPSKICGMLKIWNGTFFEKTVREVCRHICGMRSKSSSIPPCLIMARILPIWSLNTNGSFMIASIKRLYITVIKPILTILTSKFIKIFGSRSSPKNANSLFGLSFMNECINTTEHLQRRLPSWSLKPSLCLMCKTADEDRNHLLSLVHL